MNISKMVFIPSSAMMKHGQANKSIERFSQNSVEMKTYGILKRILCVMTTNKQTSMNVDKIEAMSDERI
jgi:hypothetical protein